MITKRESFNYLLDNLKYAYNNYKLVQDGNIYNKEGVKEENKRILVNTKFSILYILAYRTLKESSLRDLDVDFDRKFIGYILTDYSIFNNFINICVKEYELYSDIGTGRISYVPILPLANYIFSNETRKRILVDYLNSELSHIFKLNIDNEYVKKRV